ncbi:MAG: tRNA uridine-5-carboxymethylaminomethyl(34) synthesis GTPase MnmE [Kofleriaceae bacterium]|nr:tRNA uridine-5-carboxymethylaminomethyl(34) synthesis GTPase MnmE [Kofleriaceae bacterium]
MATPRGAGGVAIVRLSGPDAVAIAAALVGRPPAALADRRLSAGVARDDDGARLDDVLVVAMRAPRSFTGEDVAEIHGHGGVVNAGRLLRAVLARGARLAEPGEFSRRAFEHGRLDLAAAEGLLGVIEASSERAWRVAQAQLEGRMSERVAALRARLTAALAEIEACVDFPEEGLEHLAATDVAAEVAAIGAACAALAATFRLGRALRDGVEVALVGAVNAGKSSLFNALLGRERSIVSAEPGTTRDYVEARVEWDGVTVTLVDTAGDRIATEDVERRGVELGRERSRRADVVLWIDEAGAAPPAEVLEVLGDAAAARMIVVQSKGDLRPAVAGTVWTSARSGAGLDELRARVLAVAGALDGGSDEVIVTSERQRGLLAGAAEAAAAAAAALTNAVPLEMVAVDVRAALAALAALTGDEVGDDVLDVLFARFCIGK